VPGLQLCASNFLKASEGHFAHLGMRAVWWKAFIYGSIMQTILLRVVAHWGYRAPANRSFINHPLTNLSFALLGGLFVGWLGVRLHQRIQSGDTLDRFRIMLLAGGYGIIATELAIEALCILTSVFLAWHTARLSSGLLGASFLSLVEIQTYAVGILALTIPYSFIYGLIGGLWLIRIRTS
jgi:hypothetical protein